MRVQGVEHGSPARTTGAPDLWSASLAPPIPLAKETLSGSLMRFFSFFKFFFVCVVRRLNVDGQEFEIFSQAFM